MKQCAKFLSGMVLIVAICFALLSFASSANTVSEAQNSAAVNGGLQAEILTETEENATVPVIVKISNTNVYEVNGVGYMLTASENGVLSGKTSDSNLTLAAQSDMTASASLQAAVSKSSPNTSDYVSTILLIVLGIVSLAAVAFLIIKKKKLRQSLSMFLAVVILAGTFATVCLPLSTSAQTSESQISFVVTKDVYVNKQTVRLTLEVTIPAPEGDGNNTVSFMDSDNQLVKSFAVPNGKTIDANDIPILTKNGMAFNGWSLSADETLPFYSDDPIETDLTVFPIYSKLDTEKYYSPVYYDAGFVPQNHAVVVVSESEITTANLADFAVLESRFGEATSIAVTSLGNNKYELSAIYSEKGSFCWKLMNDAAVFDGIDSSIREYGFLIFGEETEEYEFSSELADISEHDFISLEATDDANISILNLFGSTYGIGDKLGIPEQDGGKTYYKVTRIISNTTNSTSGKTNWSLEVTPCTIEEVYDEIDVNVNNKEADEIIDISNPEDIENYIKQIETSEQMRVYADYIASAVNDSEEFQRLTTESYGVPAYIGYQSDALITAAKSANSAENAGNAIDEALELVGGMDINRPGINLKISASTPTINLDDFNSYWDERYSEIGEIDPKTGKRVNLGKTDFFGKKFASIKTDITVTFSLNGGTKNIAVEAKLVLKQYVKICSATKVKLSVGWEIYKGSEIDAGATIYSETTVDFTVTLKTDNGGFDISEEIDDIISAAKGEKYESDNRYIQRFRSLYDGSENDFVEVYRKNFSKFKFSVGPVEVNIPVAFIVRFGLSAGVGIGYDYRTTYTLGVYKKADSKKITPYHYSGMPGWEFNFYVAGHAGVKLGLNARLGISITCCSKLFEIGLEAELGIRADFYGYFMLSYEKEWDSYSLSADAGGAYYFNTKIYFNLKLFTSAFTFENKWSLYSWEETIFTSGERYVLLDFNKRHETQTEPIIIPVTKNSKLTTVKDGKATFKTISFSLDSYFKSLKPVFFDLQKSNEVFNNSEVQELLNKYTTVTTGGCLTLPNGISEVTGSTTVHLRPYTLTPLLDETRNEINTSITFVYNGPMFTFGDDRPSVTYNFKLVSQKYLTGERYDVRYWVDGSLYQTMQYLEGTSISPGDGHVDKEFLASIGARSAKFDIPTEKITKDMDLYATVNYLPNNKVLFNQKTMTSNGIADAAYYLSYTMSKNSDVSNIEPSAGILKQYFLGWDLEGDDSDELNVPISGKNSEYLYNAVYSEFPQYTVSIVDKATGTVLSEDKVTLGEEMVIGKPTQPNDGRAYISTISCESGDYTTDAYTLDTGSKIYPLSDITLAWTHSLEEYTVSVYSDNYGTLLETQNVKHGDFIADPLGKDNWHSLDYQSENDGYYEFSGWEAWNGTEFVDAFSMPITDNTGVFPVYKYLGIKHNITLLGEDEETVLFSGMLNDGAPLNNGYFTSRSPDKENTYELYWKSVDDESVAVNATKSGTYILCWAEKARKYVVILDDESAELANGNVVFEDGIPFGELSDTINVAIGSFVPEKKGTDYETYTYDSFLMSCDANVNGEYGICTVSFLFNAVPKKCAVSFNVNNDANNGTLWFGQNRLPLQNGVYGFEFSIEKTNTEVELNFEVVPDDRSYNFIGWSFDGRTYVFGDTVSLIGFDAAVFVAEYEIKPHIVTLEPDGGIVSESLTIYANANEHIDLPSCTKESNAQYTYRFVGWKDENNNVCTDTYQVSGSVTLTAVYEMTLRSYYITFNADGGIFDNGEASVSILTDYGIVPSPGKPTRADTASMRYTFDGWTTELSAVTGVATYTAKWKQTNLYTLTFDALAGKFSENNSEKTYVLEDGATFDISTVPIPYYNNGSEVRKFNGWSTSLQSITVEDNAEFTAIWSDPISTIGIQISDGSHTEDVAASLVGDQRVSGYSLEYVTSEEVSVSFFLLKITADGLTLSGNGAVDYTDVYAENLTLDSLTMTGKITAFGDCTITVAGTVSLTSDNDAAFILAPEYYEAPPGHLSFVGTDNAKLVVSSSQYTRGIYTDNGDISISGLNLEITSNETVDDSLQINIPVALGALDATYNISIENSSVLIHKGYLSGILHITDSVVEFDDNDFNGLICFHYDYSDNPQAPEYLVRLDNSEIKFNGKAYIEIAYEEYYNEVYISFFKDRGEGTEDDIWFMSKEELEEELRTSDGAWLLSIVNGSSISITE